MKRIIASNAPASVILVPIMLSHGFWRFRVSKLPSYGFWATANEARPDFAMLFSSLFLLIVGAGAWSIDAYFPTRHSPARGN